MREPQKGKLLRFFAALVRILPGEAPEFEALRFLCRQSQPETFEAVLKLLAKPFRFAFVNETMVEFADIGVRSDLSEPDRGRRNWKGKAAAKRAVYANRRRIRGARGKRLLRQRGERVERPNAHLYETGGMRRVHLRGHPNILKRVLVHVCGFNLGLLMRQLTGIGTPRSLQGRAAACCDALIGLLGGCWRRLSHVWAPVPPDPLHALSGGAATRQHQSTILALRMTTSATGC